MCIRDSVAGLQALHEAGLRPLPEAEARIAKAGELMQQVRDFGRYPKHSKHVASRERRLAQNLREARKEKQLSPEQESELQVLQQAEMDSRAAARIAEAQSPPDPMERFAGESESRITPHRMAKQKEYSRKYAATPHGKARKNEYNAAYYQKNEARICARQKEYYMENIDREKKRLQDYRKNNRASVAAYQRRYRAKNKEKIAAAGGIDAVLLAMRTYQDVAAVQQELHTERQPAPAAVHRKNPARRFPRRRPEPCALTHRCDALTTNGSGEFDFRPN